MVRINYDPLFGVVLEMDDDLYPMVDKWRMLNRSTIVRQFDPEWFEMFDEEYDDRLTELGEFYDE